MNKQTPRIIRVCVVGVILLALGYQLIQDKPTSPTGFNSEKLSMWMSKPFMTVGNFFNSYQTKHDEEQKVGDKLAARWFKTNEKDTPVEKYLNDLNDKITNTYNPKGLKWRIFLTEGNNAFAMPGGVIGIGRELLKNLKNESELVAVICHERGHVDLNHCYQAYQKKNAIFTQGLDFIYSKLQEEQADDYAFDFLVRLGYDPEALSHALSMLEHESHMGPKRQGTLVGAVMPRIFESHPSLAQRIHQNTEKAKRWKMENKNTPLHPERKIPNF